MFGKIQTSVPAGVEKWRKEPTFPTIATCPACGLEAVRYSGIPLLETDPPSKIAPHVRKGDETATRKRICFGVVS